MSLQIHPYVDKESWLALKQPDEKDTPAVKRLTEEVLAWRRREERLKAIDPDIDVALGMLLKGYEVLNQFLNSRLPITPVQPIAEEQISEAPIAAEPAPAKAASSKFDVMDY